MKQSCVLLATLCLAAGPSQAQNAEEPAPPTSSTADVPYAVVAEGLFAGLVQRSSAGTVDGWARTNGLDPASAAVRELLALALELDESHPRGIAPDARQELLQRFTGDEEGLAAWGRERRVRRFHAAGAAFGRWLEAREVEGFPPEFLIERLLSRQAAMVARASTVLTKEEGRSRPEFRAEAEAFEEGLRSVMDTVPQRLQSNPGLGR